MSTELVVEEEEASADTCCASCDGIAEVDDIKLKGYCSDGCQELHEPEDKRAYIYYIINIYIYISIFIVVYMICKYKCKTRAVAEKGDICCCASCGIAEVDDIKLKDCDACDLVRYCSDKCQQDHRPQHEAMCKERAAKDEILFRQPESSHFGDCQICLLPISLDTDNSFMMSCCSKLVCNGCLYANMRREFEGRLQHACPFCRQPQPKTQAEADRNEMRRIEANDPVAMQQLGSKRYREGDYGSAFTFYTKAAELGDVDAHCQLSTMYRKGEGVEKDEEKETYHLEEAAIGGHPLARYNLANNEWRNNNRIERAVKHYIIAANLGDDRSIKQLKECYAHGLVSKEDFAAALRAHQATVDATESPQREASAKAKAAGHVWGTKTKQMK